MKNVLSMRLLQFLAALCLLSVIPAKAAQSGDFTYTASGTEVTITGYTSTLGAVTIPSSIEGLPVTIIGNKAFQYRYLTSVTIPNSVTSIGDNAFDSTSLTSVTIPNSVTSIGTSAFYYCTGLTNVTIPNSVTSIGGGAFSNCSGLTSVTIPNSLTSIGSGAFGNCTGLISVTIPNSVTSIGTYAFRDCYSLTSVTIPNSVTSIGTSAFQGCYKLASIYFNGDAPYIGISALATTTNTRVYYYLNGTVGWATSFGGLNTVALGPPIINEQPFSVIANLGESVEFSVLASSSIPLPLSYQWKRNGITIQGATTATLSLNGVLGTNAGSYFVVVTNQYGSVRSSNASLTMSQGNLYTQAQFDSAFKTGYDLGVSSGGGDADVLANPNNYGLYSLSQVQALHVGTPLLAKDSATGKFKLTVGVEKSTNLVNFSPMAIPIGSATINAQGKMEFQFTSPDNAAFYRLESR
jgi:hypothetical protein